MQIFLLIEFRVYEYAKIPLACVKSSKTDKKTFEDHVDIMFINTTKVCLLANEQADILVEVFSHFNQMYHDGQGFDRQKHPKRSIFVHL